MSMEPTDIQRTIIEADGNSVVMASPGSGKTFVISEKIKRLLNSEKMLNYQGVIAISYTRKASRNLKERVLSGISNTKNSYFGTIDSFCLTQIVLPFINYVWGHSQKEISVMRLFELNNDLKDKFQWITECPDPKVLSQQNWKELKDLYVSKGVIILGAIPLLAIYVYNNSQACRKYLKARYKYIFVDEFQDIDVWSNIIFDSLLRLGLIGTAVGDPNQSIFGFSHKDSKFLKELAQRGNFATFNLKHNFRCSVPIINYAERILNPKSGILPTTENGVWLLRIEGDEHQIAKILDSEINRAYSNIPLESYSQIAILAKNNNFIKHLDAGLSIPHRVMEPTDLDSDSNPCSSLFANILRFYFDEHATYIEVVDDFVDYDDLEPNIRQRLNIIKEQIRRLDLTSQKEDFVKACLVTSQIVLPSTETNTSEKLLRKVISDEKQLSTFKPMGNEVQLMTLHKSKGLEFDIVYHLNLNEWVFPYQEVHNRDFNHPQYPNWSQDLDLHYVGVTRAKKYCFLVMTTKRHNSHGEIKQGKDSIFLSMNDLPTLRKECCRLP